MIKTAGWLLVVLGAAHTIGALTIDHAARYAGTWFSGGLWREARDGFLPMSQAGSAFWFSLESFGPPMIVIGLIVLWLDRRGITPPPFIAWILGISTVLDAVILFPTPWALGLIAQILLLIAARRAARTPRTSAT
ncbi:MULTISPECIES: DUF6463 family protein [unclassified Nocardia]|uniref:DUF6463 family protein n=1 Tax=unclassified Nocardia TaxID=2637762 RepID=UPI001CE47814|nr:MULTISPECIES: DUF6463 family protein [unclassified Nocardia]